MKQRHRKNKAEKLGQGPRHLHLVEDLASLVEERFRKSEIFFHSLPILPATLKKIAEVQRSFPPQTLVSLRQDPQTAFSFCPEKKPGETEGLEAFFLERKRDLQLLSGLRAGSPADLLRSLKKDLPPSDRQAVRLRRMVSRLFRAWPYLYREKSGILTPADPVFWPNGESLAQAIAGYDRLRSPEVKAELRVLAGQPGMGEITAAIAGFEKFFRRLQDLVRAENEVILEQAPPFDAVFRGLYGDCASKSVPLFPLLRRTATFWVRETLPFPGKILGYAFIAEVGEGSRPLPYLISLTLESFSEKKAEAVLRTLAKIYGVDHVFIADVKKSPDLVPWNLRFWFEKIASGGGAVPVKLPEGWSAMSQYHRAPFHYAEEGLSTAFLVRIKDVPGILRRDWKQREPIEFQPARTLLKDRVLVHLIATGSITSRELRALIDRYTLDSPELSTLAPSSFAHPLRQIYQNDVRVFEAHRWSTHPLLRKWLYAAFSPARTEDLGRWFCDPKLSGRQALRRAEQARRARGAHAMRRHFAWLKVRTPLFSCFRKFLTY